jgi:hypothetical protein
MTKEQLIHDHGTTRGAALELHSRMMQGSSSAFEIVAVSQEFCVIEEAMLQEFKSIYGMSPLAVSQCFWYNDHISLTV